MAFESALFEDFFEVIIWLGQSSTFGWVVAMITVSFGTYVAMVTMVILWIHPF